MTTPVTMVPAPPRAGPVLQQDGTFVQPWSGFFKAIYNLFNYHSKSLTTTQQDVQTLQQSLGSGIPATVALAPLHTGGTQGSMTFHNGILTAYTAPT